MPVASLKRPWPDRRRFLTAALLLGAGLLSFRFTAMPLGPPGIDAGWQWVVNVASENGWVLGRDLVFTYGPIGWLATPLDVGAHVLTANLFLLLLQALLIGTVFAFLRSQPSLAPIVAFAVLWPIGTTLGLRFEGFVCLVVATMLLHALWSHRSWSAIAAGVTAGLVVFVKASLGLATGATVFVATILIWRKHGLRSAAVAPITALCTASLGALLFFPSINDLISWIMLSREVVRGYAAAASIIGSPVALAGGATLLLLCAAGGLVAARRSPSFAAAALVLAPSLAVSFRLAFVRQDGHQYLFVPFVVAMLAIAGLATTHWKTAAALCASGMIAVGIGTTTGALPGTLIGTAKRCLAGHSGPQNLLRLIALDDTRQKLAEQSAGNLAQLALTDTWRQRMSSAPNGVAVVPWELMYTKANDLPLKPLRCTQLYAGHTERLDRWTAEGLSDPTSPDFVLDDFAPVGKRRALLDTPLTWRTLFLGYDLDGYDRQRGLLRLRRREHPRQYRWNDIGDGALEVEGPGLAVPSSPALVFAEIDAPLNLFGRLNQAIFRVPMLLAIFHREDGSVTWTRLIAATATHGILVSHYPHDITDYTGLWLGQAPVRVSRLQIVGPGRNYYRRNLDVRWRELELVGGSPGQILPGP